MEISRQLADKLVFTEANRKAVQGFIKQINLCGTVNNNVIRVLINKTPEERSMMFADFKKWRINWLNDAIANLQTQKAKLEAIDENDGREPDTVGGIQRDTEASPTGNQI